MADKESVAPTRVATERTPERRGMSRSEIREEQRERSRGRKSRKRFLITAGALLFALVFIGGLVLSPGLFGNNSNDLLGLNTGGFIALDSDDGRAHVNPGESHGPYSYKPATSGTHWITAPSTLAPNGAPARWGTYAEALPDEVLIHNLEHGGVGLHYDCPDGCPEILSALEDIVPSNPSQYILSPYRGIPAPYKIAITAWRHHMYLDAVDRETILKFIGEYQNRAPESVPGNSF